MEQPKLTNCDLFVESQGRIDDQQFIYLWFPSFAMKFFCQFFKIVILGVFLYYNDFSSKSDTPQLCAIVL